MRGRFHPDDGRSTPAGCSPGPATRTSPAGSTGSGHRQAGRPPGRPARPAGTGWRSPSPTRSTRLGRADPRDYAVRTWSLEADRRITARSTSTSTPLGGPGVAPAPTAGRSGSTCRRLAPTLSMEIAIGSRGSTAGRSSARSTTRSMPSPEDPPKEKEKSDPPPAEPSKPTSRTDRVIEGWTVRVDDRLLRGPDEALGTRAPPVPGSQAESTSRRSCPPTSWRNSGRSRSSWTCPTASSPRCSTTRRRLAEGERLRPRPRPKCVHIPRAADLATRRNIREQPWVILHELARTPITTRSSASTSRGSRQPTRRSRRAVAGTRPCCMTADGSGTTP